MFSESRHFLVTKFSSTLENQLTPNPLSVDKQHKSFVYPSSSPLLYAFEGEALKAEEAIEKNQNGTELKCELGYA